MKLIDVGYIIFHELPNRTRSLKKLNKKGESIIDQFAFFIFGG